MSQGVKKSQKSQKLDCNTFLEFSHDRSER